MPRVVIEEFVKDLDDEDKEDSDNEKEEKPHKLLTHHEIDDFSKIDSNKASFGLQEVSPLDGR
jgi:hypothetical protein